MQLMKEGRGSEAKEYFQRSVDITPEMALDVIRAARDRNVDCIVAPYEADAQLAYLANSGIADFVVTEDSDLTLFGCERVLFKLIDSGDCVLYEKEHLNKVFGLQADLLSFDKFRYMCITAGCDYLANLPGIGLGKAKNFWLKVTNPDLRNVLRKIPAYLKMPQVAVTQDYIEKFIRANNTFLYQLVFDPVTRKEKPLTPYPDALSEAIESMTYCGTYSPPDIAAQMALGNMNIRSQRQVDNFDPDMTGMNLNVSSANPKYGKRASHRSMWCRDFIEKGPKISGSGISQQSSYSSQNSSQSEMKPSLTRPQVKRSKGIEKRKAGELPEEEVEKMLLEENEEGESPPRKRTKSDFSKNRKIVGLDGDSQGQGQKVISKYFVKASPTIATNNPTENVVPKGRRNSMGESGAWFNDIEKPISAEGKFIYRPDKDIQPIQINVLKEVGNSPERTFESPAQRQRRNPFAKKLSSSPVIDLVAHQSETAPIDENRDEHSQPDNSQKSLEVTLPSSQLSMFSMDGESLTFSSQDPMSQMSVQSSASSPASSPSGAEARASVTSPTPSISTAPRLGLSKKSAASSSQSITRSVMGPAKVSGLIRKSGVASIKSKSGDGKIQTKLSSMFARSVTKAQIGQHNS